MAVDREFRVRVSTVSDVRGASEAASALKRVGDVGADAQHQVERATEKTIGAQKMLRDALQGAASQFPEFAAAARVFINPITAAIAGMAAALSIWKRRVSEASNILAGMSLPDATGLNPARIGAATEAWLKYAAALKGVDRGVTSVEANASRALRILEASIERQRVLDEARAKTLDPDDPYAALSISAHAQQSQLLGRQAVLDAKRKEAEDLRASAAAKVKQAGAIRVASSEADAWVMGKWGESEKVAVAMKEQASQRLDLIMNWRENGATADWWEATATGAQMLYRYGFKSLDEAERLERDAIGRADAVIGEAGKIRAGEPYRKEARAERDRLYSEAGTERGRAAKLDFEIGTESMVLQSDIGAASELNRLAAISTLSAAIEDSEQKAEQLKSQALSAKNATSAVMGEVASKLIQLTSEMNRMKEDLRRMESIQGGLR